MEALSVSVQPVPGAVFLRLKREVPGEKVARMFVELTPGEALLLWRELRACIGVAGATAR